MMDNATDHRSGVLHFFAQHRVAANLLMTMMVLAGICGLIKLNTQFFPNFALDFASVRVVWSGASAEDVEASLVKPIEQELRNLHGLKKITSTSATGLAAITLEFEEGTDMGSALDDINERMARIRNLPSTAEDPEITRIVRYEPIARLLLSTNSGVNELRKLAYQVKDDLLDRGVARVDVHGLPEQELSIEVPQQRLQELDITLTDVANQVARQSRDIPAGMVGESDVARQMRSLDQRRAEEEFEFLPLFSGASGQRLLLGDVADVELRDQDGQTYYFVNGRPSVELGLKRSESADALSSARILEQWLEEVAVTLPPNVKVSVYDESWTLIYERIMLLVTNGLGGLLLVILILFLFLNGRIAFWVTIGIPVSFMATLGIVYVVGGSINMISLFGLIMALGIIVDDAIVVAENAQSNYEKGESPQLAAENSARRMFAPVASSSLTTIAAFLPLMMVGGIIGNIMFQIPLVVICVVIASFIECMLVLPAHMRFSLASVRKEKTTRIRQKLDDWFEAFREHTFRKQVTWAVKNRGLTVCLAVSALVLSVAIVASGRIGFTFFPGAETKILYANANFTSGTPKERVEAFLNDLEKSLRETEQALGGGLIETSVVMLGRSSSADAQAQRTGEQYGSMVVELVSPDQREVRNIQFIEAWRSRIEAPPGIESLALSQRQTGPPGQDIDIRLRGDDPLVLKQAAAELIEKLATYPGVSAIEDDLPWGREQLVYQLTPLGQSLGLTVEKVGQQLRAAFDGVLVQIYQDGDDEVEVRVALPENERDHLSSLDNLYIKLEGGGSALLHNVVSLTSRKGFEALRHSDGALAVRVSADVNRALNNSNRILEELKADYLPELTGRYHLTYDIEGRAADQGETIADMKKGSLFALLFIYIILIWVFASYSKPLVIMLAIPFGFIGAVVGHLALGLELTILSLFGIVGLSGIVVNDAIILITYYQQLLKQGMVVQDAIIEAACARLRAVLLTSMTTIAGLTPLLFEGSVQAQFLIPMAVSITFGLAFATVLVLIVIPAILSYVESLTALIKRQLSNNAVAVNQN